MKRRYGRTSCSAKGHIEGMMLGETKKYIRMERTEIDDAIYNHSLDRQIKFEACF